MNIPAPQRAYFATGITRPEAFRRQALERLRRTITEYERELYDALWKDLHKSEAEAYLTEIAITLKEIDLQLRHLKEWMKPETVPTPLYLKPSRSKVIHEPYGVALIISPWNYPVQLTFAPLIGAIAAGNCAVLKVSPDTPTVSAVIRRIVEKAFLPDYITVVEGHKEVVQELLAERWDYIFFTGSPSTGKVIMRAAAEYLTPVTLELGGKSPCIVDRTADADTAAKRIVWGKFLNAGQTCIAPDYMLVHEQMKIPVLERIRHYILQFYGSDPQQSEHYGRIVNDSAYQRLKTYLKEGMTAIGGKHRSKDRYIAPTVLTDIRPGDAVMQQEIFGPILPVLEFKELDEAIEFVNSREKPLALYYFGDKSTGEEVLSRTTSGGACINDVMMQLANENLPFGGVGNSGIGRYHGHDSFLAFSNRRSVLSSPKEFDIPAKYPPYDKLKWLKKLM